MAYEERLKLLGLTIFRTRMLRADLIEVYKILNGMDKLDPNRYFTRSEGNTRGHSCKMFKKSFNLDIGKYRFSNRICLEWNSLSEDIVDAKNLNSFKDKLDRHLKTVRGFT